MFYPNPITPYIPYNGSDAEDHCPPLIFPVCRLIFSEVYISPRFLSKREVLTNVDGFSR